MNAVSEIIGVAGDVRDSELESIGRPAIYQPAAQQPYNDMYFAIRTAGDPTALIPAARSAIHALDPELPLDAVGTVDALLASGLAQRRFAMLLMAIFAGARTAARHGGNLRRDLGIQVNQATQEIGIPHRARSWRKRGDADGGSRTAAC